MKKIGSFAVWACLFWLGLATVANAQQTAPSVAAPLGSVFKVPNLLAKHQSRLVFYRQSSDTGPGVTSVFINERKPGGTPADMEEGYYRILVRIKDANQVRKGVKMEPTPGMTASVEIRTGQKTVLEYLFRPLQNVSQALRER